MGESANKTQRIYTSNACIQQMERTLSVDDFIFLIFSGENKDSWAESHWPLQLGKNLCQACCGASSCHDEKTGGGGSAVGLEQYNKAALYRFIEKTSFNKKNPDGVQVGVRKSELAF